MFPEYRNRDSVPSSVLKKERKIIEGSDELKGKQKNVMSKIIEGKLEKFYEEKCLMEQKFFKDDEVTITDLMNEAVAKIGEKIEIGRIYRMVVGG